MAKQKDIGLELVQKLGIRAAKDMQHLFDSLVFRFGSDYAHRTIRDMHDLAKKGFEIDYDVKNRDPDFAIAYSGGYDADFVRKACNWIASHREYFGSSILEVGCDCGFMTCVLGFLFPDKHIVAIDRNQSGINVAKKNVEKFGLNNVEFICTEVSNLNGVLFDTVFSMRTLHENGEKNHIDDVSYDLDYLGNIIKDRKLLYARALSDVLKDNGSLVCIERLGRDIGLLGWIKALKESGIEVDSNSYDELDCMELDDLGHLPVFVGNKHGCSDVSASNCFSLCCMKYIDTTQGEYFGWNAKVVYEILRESLIEGFVVENNLKTSRNVVALWTCSNDESAMVFYESNNTGARVQILNKSSLTQLSMQITQEKRRLIGDSEHIVSELPM